MNVYGSKTVTHEVPSPVLNPAGVGHLPSEGILSVVSHRKGKGFVLFPGHFLHIIQNQD